MLAFFPYAISAVLFFSFVASIWIFIYAQTVPNLEKKFKTSHDSSFFRRYHEYTNVISQILSNSPFVLFYVEPSSLQINGTKKLKDGVEVLENNRNGEILYSSFSFVYVEIIRSADLLKLSLEIDLYSPGIIRVSINEQNWEQKTQKRFQIPPGDVIDEETLKKLKIDNAEVKQNDKETIITSAFYVYNDNIVEKKKNLYEYENYNNEGDLVEKEKHNFRIVINHEPFALDIHLDEECIMQMNTKQLLNWERMGRNKADVLKPMNKENEDYNKFNEINTENKENMKKEGEKKFVSPAHDGDIKICDAVDVYDLQAWNEEFSGFVDEIKYGPNAIGADFTFPNSIHAFGVPEHAGPFNLKEYEEPYRAYNVDTFNYSDDSPASLYGSIPLTHFIHKNKNITNFAFLWVNPSETWMTLHKNATEISSSWVSETGLLEFFVFLGPKHYHTLTQYYTATGFPAMAPLFSIAKHQCRWNYINEADVKNINEQFNDNDIPYDVIWLDIEHTDQKKYFTWDKTQFPNPKELLEYLDKDSRKLVTIVDPHFKTDENYFVYNEAKENNYLTKNSADKIFIGHCWPGNSAYADLLNPKAREWLSNLYSYDKYIGSASNLFIWNDMNEPSVFNEKELTMPKNNIHYGGVEHREIHNLYGLYFHRSTYEGLLKRGERECDGKGRRPFVLSRSYFISSHRYGFIWTGDNQASWRALAVSLPMILSNAIAGLSACGADVGGFHGNPDEELYARWHQIGIWYPFYREHAHIDSKRREPWEWHTAKNLVRNAIITRYKLLPFWYTLFAEYSLKGTPIVRPLWWINLYNKTEENLTEEEKKDIYMLDDAYLIGDVFYVKAITKSFDELKQQHNGYTQLYLPKTLSGWYDYYTGQYYGEYGNILSHTKLTKETIPVFVNAESIIATKEIIRKASSIMAFDPYTLHIYLSNESLLKMQKAFGHLYVDDGESFDYKNGKFLYQNFQLYKNILNSKKIPMKNLSNQFNQTYVWGSYKPPNTEVERIVIWGASQVPNTIRRYKDMNDNEGEKLHFSYTVIRSPIITDNNYLNKEITEEDKVKSKADVIEKCTHFKETYKIEIKKPFIHIGNYEWKIIFN